MPTFEIWIPFVFIMAYSQSAFSLFINFLYVTIKQRYVPTENIQSYFKKHEKKPINQLIFMLFCQKFKGMQLL